MADPSETPKKLGGRLGFLFASIATAMLALVVWAAIWNLFFNLPERGEILREHVSAIVGIPIAATFAFVLVIFLRQAGPIEIEGFGFKFKGVAGPLIMWVICFLAIAGALKMLW